LFKKLSLYSCQPPTVSCCCSIELQIGGALPVGYLLQ
jgi:hypothetical protein